MFPVTTIFPFQKEMHLLIPPWNTTIFAMSWKQRHPKSWVSGWLTFWCADWVTDWLCGWLTDWLAVMWTDLLTDLLTNIVVNWLADWLNYWLAVLLINWLTDSHWLTDHGCWLIDYWLEWLVDILRFMERKESRLLIVNQDYWLLMKMVNFSFQMRCDQQMS